jgi:hypothetical protein
MSRAAAAAAWAGPSFSVLSAAAPAVRSRVALFDAVIRDASLVDSKRSVKRTYDAGLREQTRPGGRPIAPA